VKLGQFGGQVFVLEPNRYPYRLAARERVYYCEATTTTPFSGMDAAHSGLEQIEEAGAFLVGDFDGFPVEEVGGFFALDFAHEAAAGVGAGIGGTDQSARKSAAADEKRPQELFGRTDSRDSLW
jgi:hypothetical protein